MRDRKVAGLEGLTCESIYGSENGKEKKSEMKGQGSYYGKGGTTEIKSSER